MVFNRDLYINKLISASNNDMIKITGVRRCGKSYQVIAWATPTTNIRVYGRYPHNETPAAFSVAGVPLIVVSKVVVISSKIVVVMPYF